MAKRAILAVLFSAVGCGGLTVDQSKVVAPPEHAAEAIEIVANFYGLRGRPQIVWYGGDALTCGTNNAGYIGTDGTCVGGEQDRGLIILSDRRGVPIHMTGLSHELGHFASDERGEGGDQYHVGHFFRDPMEAVSMPFNDTHGLAGDSDRNLASLGM